MRRFPIPLGLALLACWSLPAPALVAGAEAPAPGEPYLVRDIDTTGEPYLLPCHFLLCPPPVFGSLIEQLMPFGDLLVFVANDRIHGFEPWVSDGTAEGTRLLADTCPGACEGLERVPQLLGVLDGRLYFWVDGTSSGGAGLWVTDGTPEGTHDLPELCPELCSTWNRVEGPGVVFEGALLFQVYEAAESNRFLWRTDGTAAGTERILPVCTRSIGCLEKFTNFFVYRGRLFFNDWDDMRRLASPQSAPAVAWGGKPTFAAPLGSRMILGLNASIASLWVMDGPLAEPRDPIRLGVGTSLSQLTSAGGLVYFVLRDGAGEELWRTDGTGAGTARVVPHMSGRFVRIVGVFGGGPIVSVTPEPGPLPVVLPTFWRLNPAGGPQEALSSLPVRSVAVAGERIFFSAEDELGRELWVSDGTGEGTRLLADIAPGPASSEPGVGGLKVPGFAVAGDRLFFPAHHPDTDIELWALDLNTEEPLPPPPPPPPPPGDGWLESAALAGFRVQVRITAGGQEIPGRAEGACIPETLCVSGALPGRSEVFVRVVGPRPNGFLWPTLVKFSTSEVEVWIEQLATGELRYYRLEGAAPGSSELPGLFDRTGFEPE